MLKRTLHLSSVPSCLLPAENLFWCFLLIINTLKLHQYHEKCFMQLKMKDTNLCTSIVLIKTLMSCASPSTLNNLRSSSVFEHWKSTWSSSWTPFPQLHSLFSTSIRAQRPVSIFKWWEQSLNLVNSKRSLSLMYCFVVYVSWTDNSGFIFLYATAFDPSWVLNFSHNGTTCCCEGFKNEFKYLKPFVRFLSQILYILTSGVSAVLSL